VRARLAFDRATPLERTLARLSDEDSARVVASAAAKQITTVDSFRRLVTGSSCRADGSGRRVEGAVIRRVLQIDEIIKVRWLGLAALAVVVQVVSRDQLSARWVRSDFQRNVIFLLQMGTDLQLTSKIVIKSTEC